jgi:hypothetical protein
MARTENGDDEIHVCENGVVKVSKIKTTSKEDLRLFNYLYVFATIAFYVNFKIVNVKDDFSVGQFITAIPLVYTILYITFIYNRIEITKREWIPFN